ncbi:hypothetical protein ACH9EU_07030 [Kocuria sp. M1R5S2]|uniref:hypothetical protein n=1 Tax=Kocuria rhizosphaerae TaxID=3376285 RepID=UPI0037BB6993
MIPTMIVFGLVLGRWWKSALVASAVVWPALLVASGTMGLSANLLGGALLGVLNAAVGVTAHQGILRVVRRIRRDPHPVG